MNGHFWLWKFLAAPMSFWTVNRVRIWPTWGGPTKKRHVFHVLASVRLRSYKNSTMLFLAPFKARRVSLSHPFAFSIPFWIVKGKIFFFPSTLSFDRKCFCCSFIDVFFRSFAAWCCICCLVFFFPPWSFIFRFCTVGLSFIFDVLMFCCSMLSVFSFVFGPLLLSS